MTIEWTEAFQWVSIGASLSWQTQIAGGAPANSIAAILMLNGDAGTDVTLGCRAVGSSLERKILLHEAESGGNTACMMFVKVDSNAEIQIYSDGSNGLSSFYLMGYWTGVDFTELAADHTPTGTTGWKNNILSLQPSRVYQIICANRSPADGVEVGVRTMGSSLERRLYVHEAETAGTPAPCNCISMCVKTDSSGDYQTYWVSSAGIAITYYIWGYFDSTMDYVELLPQAGSITNTSSWNNPADYTASLDVDGRVVDCYVMHGVANSEQTIGVRGDGSSLNRYAEIEESESNDYTGYGVPTKTDASGVINFYSTTSDTNTGILGYYKPGAVLRSPATYVTMIG